MTTIPTGFAIPTVVAIALTGRSVYRASTCSAGIGTTSAGNDWR
jgi:hypothetical protein